MVLWEEENQRTLRETLRARIKAATDNTKGVKDIVAVTDNRNFRDLMSPINSLLEGVIILPVS